MTTALALPRMRRLRLSPTLSGYIARVFVVWFLGLFLAITGVILLVSAVDMLNRLANEQGVTLALVLQLVLLRAPHLSQEVMPFTMLFASMGTFWRLTRTQELVVARAAGVSVWQFLLPVVGVAVAIAMLTVAVVNPLGAILLGRSEQLEARYFGAQTSSLAVSPTGVWLRQADLGGQSVIHADRVSQESMTLHNVIVFRYENVDRFIERIDAARAKLSNGKWQLRDAWVSQPGKSSRFVEQVAVPTDLTADKIREGFAPPETISFWSLPAYIELLEEAGFSAQPHKLQFHRLLAVPMLFAAMVLLAASFSLRPQRRGQVGVIMIAGIASGFLLHFLSNFVFALGLSAKLPVILAAWTPAGVSLMIGISMLLHMEDG